MFHRIVVAAVMLGLSLAISQGADAQALPELQPRLGGRAI